MPLRRQLQQSNINDIFAQFPGVFNNFPGLAPVTSPPPPPPTASPAPPAPTPPAAPPAPIVTDTQTIVNSVAKAVTSVHTHSLRMRSLCETVQTVMTTRVMCCYAELD